MDDPQSLVCQAVYLLTARGACYQCRRETRMHALMALPPFSWIGEADEGIDDDGPMLRETSSLPLPLANIVKTRTGDRMRPDYSRTADESYWMNDLAPGIRIP